MEYPLEVSFKGVGSRISVTDASGDTVAYSRPKTFTLREHINIFADEDQQQHIYTIQANADQAVDVNPTYEISTPDGDELGSVSRQGMRSIWRATYEIMDPSGNQIGSIHEEDPWVKAIDGLLGLIPLVGALTGYVFHPAYLINLNGATRFRVQKQSAFFEGRFTMEQQNGVSESEQDLILPSVIMMLILERSRG